LRILNWEFISVYFIYVGISLKCSKNIRQSLFVIICLCLSMIIVFDKTKQNQKLTDETRRHCCGQLCVHCSVFSIYDYWWHLSIYQKEGIYQWMRVNELRNHFISDWLRAQINVFGQSLVFPLNSDVIAVWRISALSETHFADQSNNTDPNTIQYKLTYYTIFA